MLAALLLSASLLAQPPAPAWYALRDRPGVEMLGTLSGGLIYPTTPVQLRRASVLPTAALYQPYAAPPACANGRCPAPTYRRRGR
jgi:hypothetical protein